MSARPIRRFTEVLGLLDQGQFEAACDRAVNEALETLEAMPKEKGIATITIELKIAFDGGRVDIAPKIKAKLPENAFGRTPFWAFEGALSTQHPSQMDMFVRAAAERTAATSE